MKPPIVKRGLTNATLAGQQYQIPRAFMDRIMYDASVGYRNVGIPNQRQMMNKIYGPPKDNQHVAYTGLSDFLNQMKNKYAGQGYMNTEQQKLVDMRQKIRQQPKVRQVKINPYGDVLSDTGPKLRKDDWQSLVPATNRAERKQRSDLMKDLQKFKNITKSQTTSNLPIKVTRPQEVRSSMNKHLNKLNSITN